MSIAIGRGILHRRSSLERSFLRQDDNSRGSHFKQIFRTSGWSSKHDSKLHKRKKPPEGSFLFVGAHGFEPRTLCL